MSQLLVGVFAKTLHILLLPLKPITAITVNVIKLDIVVTFSYKIGPQNYYLAIFSTVIVIIWLL